MASHTLVQATLHIPPSTHGPHLFIVPVRDPKTLAPLPNIQIGDIGTKASGGFASIDNGFVRFEKVRVPRENMLQRYSQVTPQGEFVSPKHDKLSYGSMVTLRVSVVTMESWNLARAVTIATRYTSVRRQFRSSPDTAKEDQVITYSSVQSRLFPLLGITVAYIFAAKGLWTLYLRMMRDLTERGESLLLGEVHALSSGLKVCCSWDCVAGVEECRKACGGHGFSAYSGIGHIWANGVASQTYEGASPLLWDAYGRG
jgi:acyl-CoA oxidase